MGNRIFVYLALGALVGLIFTAFQQSARRKITEGTIQHGPLPLIMAWFCTFFAGVFVWIFIFDDSVFASMSSMVLLISLMILFAGFAWWSFVEYYKIRGTFDYERIKFHTPWTGSKHELWDDLVSVEYVDSMSWYILKFESGVIIRISEYLQGHAEVIEILQARGFDIE